MTVHAYSVQDAYIYGFALQETRHVAPRPRTTSRRRRSARWRTTRTSLADFPHLVEVVGGHVAKAGYDYESEFLFGLDLILDGLDKLRET